MSERPAIRAEGIEKHFGETKALRGLNLEAEQGKVLGVLGPNGAGKTTAVRIFSTLIKPDAGFAEVGGHDVVKHPDLVRQTIGLTGQYAALDEHLTGWENLDMFGRLYHLPKKFVKERVTQLLEHFDLVDAAKRPIKTYSGGMRRRLDLAASLITSPKILFLDEPTTGLDPRSRLAVWEILTDLVAQGTTLLLTTQYLEEADQLADQIAVIDKGTVIAKGTSDELKTQVGGERLELTVSHDSTLSDAVAVLEKYGEGSVHFDEEKRSATVAMTSGAMVLADVIRSLDDVKIKLVDFGLRRPTLDDVFLTLTGHVAEDEQSEEGAAK